MTNKHYGTKESWETYAHETPNKYATPDHIPASRRYPCVWRDRVGYRVVYVTTANQHKCFRKLMETVGNENLLNVGIPSVSALRLFGRVVIKTLVKNQVFRFAGNQRMMLHTNIPGVKVDPFMKQGLACKEAVKRVSK